MVPRTLTASDSDREPVPDPTTPPTTATITKMIETHMSIQNHVLGRPQRMFLFECAERRA